MATARPIAESREPTATKRRHPRRARGPTRVPPSSGAAVWRHPRASASRSRRAVADAADRRADVLRPHAANADRNRVVGLGVGTAEQDFRGADDARRGPDAVQVLVRRAGDLVAEILPRKAREDARATAEG